MAAAEGDSRRPGSHPFKGEGEEREDVSGLPALGSSVASVVIAMQIESMNLWFLSMLVRCMGVVL